LIRTAILTVSDRASRGEYEDESGRILREGLPDDTYEIVESRIVPDEVGEIAPAIRGLAARADLVLTTGGTGLGPRDVTPDVTEEVIQRRVPGIVEALRADGRRSNPASVLSRGVAGTFKRTLIINLPGSPKAVKAALGALLPILPHAIAMLHGEGHQ
jgi:molybdopterin adenylyltransferase